MVARARESFLASDDKAPKVRQEILASWKRSRFWGVAPDDLEMPYRPDLDFDSRLVRAARPVLDRLERQLTGTDTSVILTDARGLVLDRRVEGTGLQRRLDAISLAPGFSYAEEHVGTNGIGTAIEQGQVSCVFGAEHFTERLQLMSCAGAPIRDPLSGRLEGVIDLTTRSEQANPLMPALVQETATLIEQRLAEGGSERERALLREFMATARVGRGAIFSVTGDLVIVNAAAARLLAPSDHQLLRERADELLAGHRDVSEEILLSQGHTVRLRCRPALGGGAVMEIHVVGDAPAGRPVTVPPPGVAGGSPGWTRVCQIVEAACRSRSWLLLRGEAGVGKLAVVRAMHRRLNPAARFAVIDAADLRSDATSWIGRLRSDLGAPMATVVLRHLERLPADAATRLAGMLEPAGHRAWVVGTVTGPANLPHSLLGHFSESLVVPPLRHRVDDVRDIVPVLLRRHAAHRRLICSPQAMHTLLRAPWPGNVAQLDRVVQAAVTARPTGRIEPGDLPDECHTTSRHVLTPMEAIERDAISRALDESGGDKRKAAARLGISRATVYRKIRAFGLEIRSRA
ncbi:MAG: modulated sigma54 specific transcriptional regulator, Fis family [Actinoallomurus sp.]|jgi:transcriptional regulator of acetoin/glycerol metabolism|nr:modulated sigma54 specific transcriptional regulator, Fis family [Actinoallomurus sp.]